MFSDTLVLIQVGESEVSCCGQPFLQPNQVALNVKFLSTMLEKKQQRSLGSRPVGRPTHSSAVSYTHLDVYKRQKVQF